MHNKVGSWGGLRVGMGSGLDVGPDQSLKVGLVGGGLSLKPERLRAGPGVCPEVWRGPSCVGKAGQGLLKEDAEKERLVEPQPRNSERWGIFIPFQNISHRPF